MKYSSTILKKYISLSASPEQCANELTLRTCEIEHITKRETPKSVVIGKVTACEKHPNADTLRVCQVHCGTHGNYQICTGGENIMADVYVPVALPGTYLPLLDITIESRKLRGVDSSGMICSKGELGINEDNDKHRIRILQHSKAEESDDIQDITDSDIGMSLSDKLPRIDTFTFEVDNKTITHRPDLTGHFGLACELNAIYRMHSPEELTFENTSTLLERVTLTPLVQMLESSPKSSKKLHITSDLVHSYMYIQIPDIVVHRSSLYTRSALLELGSTPRNNWVDFSNMFMYVTGQPIHCFDADKIHGDIFVKQLEKTEEFIDLMGQKHQLEKGDLVICDQEKVIAIAGIIGGQNSAITENTKNIGIEMANFDGVHIRRTALRLGMRTDAAMRFEKSINPLFSLQMIHRLLDELKYHRLDLGETNIQGMSYWYGPQVEHLLSSPQKVHIDTQKVNERIYGYVNLDILSSTKKLLTHLGYTIHEHGESQREIQTPRMRSPHDITLSEDIMEEIARISGYDQVKPLALTSQLMPKKISTQVDQQRKCENLLIHRFGYQQLETYPRFDLQGFEKYTSENKLLSLKNPLNPESIFLRDSMLYNLFKHAEKNAPFFEHISCFDIGKTRTTSSQKKETDRLHYPTDTQESMTLGMLLCTSQISSRQQDPTLIQKHQICNVLKNLLPGEHIVFKPASHTGYHPKKYAHILAGSDQKVVGYIGQIHPYTIMKSKFDEKKCVSYAEINLTALENFKNSKKTDFSAHEAYETLQDQIITRDFSFVIDADQSFEKILETAKQTNHIEHVHVFDIYQGTQLPKDKKSISFGVKIKGTGNMTTQEINEIMDAVITKAKDTGAILRKDF